MDENLLSIDEVEKYKDSLMVYGYYGEKNFGISINNNEFTLIYDDTECTDDELQGIFNYLMSHKELLIVR